MEEATRLVLQERKWEAAVPLLEEELQKAPKDSIIRYNLILSLIEIGSIKYAKKLLAESPQILEHDDVAVLQSELAKAEASLNGAESKDEEEDDHKKEIPKFSQFTSTTKFDDVVGLEEAKGELRMKVLNSLLHPEIYAKFNASVSGGIMLYGPPGTGKTLLGRAIAGEANSKMFLMNIHEILSPYQGNSEKAIHELFEEARKNKPSIIFLDEMDALAQNRANVNEFTGGSMKTIIDTFLSEMDGMQNNNSGIAIIGTTNRPWDVDLAFKRANRFEDSIYIKPPRSIEERKRLFRFYVKGIKEKSTINYSKLALATFGYTPSDIARVCRNTSKRQASQAVDRNTFRRVGTKAIMHEIRLAGMPVLFEWYASTYKELSKLTPEARHGYSDLVKDLTFWYLKSRRYRRLYKFINMFLN